MLVLVIDTSSAAVTTAVCEIDSDVTGPDSAGAPAVSLRAERVTVDGRGHGERLAPAIGEVLAAAGAARSDLAAVVAGLGPGPFTGLRVGLVTAAALGDALGLPTYGVDSLDGIGHALDGSDPDSGDGDVLVATDARRREVYWAVYSAGARRADPQVGRPADVRAALDGSVTAAAGAGARQYADVLGLPLCGPDFPSALELARAAADRVRRHAAGELLRPQYLRQPDAVAPETYKTVTPPGGAR